MSRMHRMLIELNDEEAAQLKELATEHGQRVKPFVEYLLRMQLGIIPPPSVKPVKVARAQVEPQTDIPERKPAQSAPQEEATQTATAAKPRPDVAALQSLLKPSAQEPPKRIPKPWAPNKNLSAYTEETDTGSGIFTDGKSFAVQAGPVGRQTAHFFEYLHEAEEFQEEHKPF